MDEKGSKQVDVLDVQPAAAAREQVAAAGFEWQLRLHKTMLVRFLPPIKISVEVPLCIVEHRHCRLLAARGKGPRRRAAKQRDECAPFHSITSSARTSSVGGISQPIAL